MRSDKYTVIISVNFRSRRNQSRIWACDSWSRPTSILIMLLCTLFLFSLRANARPELRLEAGARQLGSDKARSVQARFLIAPVENRTCGFDRIRLSTFDRSPWSDHEASVPISPVPQVSTCVQLARSLGTFVSLFSKARGLRHQSFSWCTQLSWVQTTMPLPTLREGLGVSLGSPLPTSHSPSHPSRSLPCSAWKTQTERCRWRVSLLAPSALCGSPVFAQRVGQVDLCDEGNTSQTGLPSSVLSPLVYDFRLD